MRETMNAKEFIRDTLIQIIEGVREAGERAKELGAAVGEGPRIAAEFRDGYDRVVREVEFDIALIAEASSGGGAKVSVWGIGGGLEGASKDSVASRIKFSVPVGLPKGQ